MKFTSFNQVKNNFQSNRSCNGSRKMQRETNSRGGKRSILKKKFKTDYLHFEHIYAINSFVSSVPSCLTWSLTLLSHLDRILLSLFRRVEAWYLMKSSGFHFLQHIAWICAYNPQVTRHLLPSNSPKEGWNLFLVFWTWHSGSIRGPVWSHLYSLNLLVWQLKTFSKPRQDYQLIGFWFYQWFFVRAISSTFMILIYGELSWHNL